MKKILTAIFFVLLFLLITGPASAASIAGDSANLALNTQISKVEAETVRDFRKRLAIKAVLDKYDSPMADEVDNFLTTCKKYSLNCYLLPSIAGLESTFGRFISPGSFNPFGWGRGLIPFKSWAESIDVVGGGLKTNYIDQGATTVEEIGQIYCEGNTWASKIRWFMTQFETEEEKLSLYASDFPVQL